VCPRTLKLASQGSDSFLDVARLPHKPHVPRVRRSTHERTRKPADRGPFSGLARLARGDVRAAPSGPLGAPFEVPVLLVADRLVAPSAGRAFELSGAAGRIRGLCGLGWNALTHPIGALRGGPKGESAPVAQRLFRFQVGGGRSFAGERLQTRASRHFSPY
jgi:hypothetical protein